MIQPLLDHIQPGVAMQESKSIIIRPSSRTLIVYYTIGICISLSFGILALIVLFDPKERIDIGLWLCVVGVFGGIGIAGIVACVHLEMRVSRYTVTDTEAQSRWGLLFKRNDVVQLGSVKSITIHQNPIQRLFNTGDLVLRTTGHSSLVMWDVEQPEMKKEEIWQLVMKVSSRSRFRYSSSQ